MKTARIGEIDIHYEVFGEGVPVLLLMGLGARGDSWTPLSKALAGAGHMAIQLDNRDVGWSSKLAGRTYEMADMAADALGLLDHLGISQANIIGLSMGGMIAQEILISHPTRVLRAVLMATSPGGPNAVQPPPEVVASLLAGTQDPTAMLRAMYTAITAPGFASANPALVDLAVEAALKKPTHPEAIGRQLAAILRWSSWDRLPSVKTPTLVVHGNADPLVPYANGVLISERIPDARLFTLQGVGHLVPMEAPVATFGALSSFLRDEPLPSP